MNYFEIGNENRCGEVIQPIFPPPETGWGHIQSSGATTFNTQTLDATFPDPVSVGNLIVVGVGNDVSGGACTITDNFSSVPYARAVVGGSGGTAAIFWHIVRSGEGGYPFTVSFTSENPTYPVISIDEYRIPGVPNIVVDSAGTAEGISALPSLAGPLAITDIDLVYCVCKPWFAVSQTVIPTPGFTARYEVAWDSSPPTNGFFAEDHVNVLGMVFPGVPSMMSVNGRLRCRRIYRQTIPSGSTNIDMSLTLAPGSNWVMAAAAFKCQLSILGWRLII